MPPRYDRGDWKEGDGVFHAGAIVAYTLKLAIASEGTYGSGTSPWSWAGTAPSSSVPRSRCAHRIGRYGIAVIDRTADFRHPGVSDRVGAASGDELALATGCGQADLTDPEGLRPYVQESEHVRRGYEAVITPSNDVAPTASTWCSRSQPTNVVGHTVRGVFGVPLIWGTRDAWGGLDAEAALGSWGV